MKRSLIAVSLILAALLGLSSSPPMRSCDVTAYGAKGDGSADDTDAVRKAIAAQPGMVRFPRGTYRLTKTVEIALDETGFTALEGGGVGRVIMAGAGPAFRFVGTHAGTAAPASVKANVWDKQRTPMIDGLEIVGAHPEACGVEARGTMQLTLTRVTVRKCLHAVHLTGRNRNVLIDACHFYENSGVGVYYDDVNLHQSNIVGSHISYCRGGGVVSRKGDVRNIHISGCDIEGNASADGPPTANVLLDAHGTTNGVGEVAITGCTLQHGREGKDSANVRILGKSLPSKDMPVVRQGHVTITGNVLSDVQVNVHLSGCRGVTVVGNTFWEGYAHDLLVEDSHSVVVGSNNLDRNPHYDRYGKAKEARNAVEFRGCEDSTVSGLHVTNVCAAPGLRLTGCRRMNLSGCTVLDCALGGVVMEDCTDCLLSGFVVRADGVEKPGLSLTVKGGKGNRVDGGVWRDGVEAPKGTVGP